MWPTLVPGETYRVQARGCRGSRPALLLRIGADGRLELAERPGGPNSRWRPWALERAQVVAVFGRGGPRRIEP